MDKRIKILLSAIASDGDLAVVAPQYRQAALELLAEREKDELIWTIKEPSYVYPKDEVLKRFALSLPTDMVSKTPRRPKQLPDTPFAVERFGNSAHLYLWNGKTGFKRVGLFMWT